MAKWRGLNEADLKGRRVLTRVDLNLPMQDGRITDDLRLQRILPTIRAIADKGGRVILLSHFDRPKGKRVPEMSLAPIAQALGAALGRKVAFAVDCIGPEAQAAVDRMRDGETLLLENTRFHAGEEKNDPEFARALAALGDVYVNDAFSAAHRAHASTEGLARLLPAFAGLAMEKELASLEAALGQPKRPVAALVGGAKISTKLEVLDNLSARVDRLIVGGGMANTFLFAKGVAVGKSLCERDMADRARAIMDHIAKRGGEILLPIDAVVAREFKAGAQSQTVAIDAVPDDGMILDIGPRSAAMLEKILTQCHTLVWNGPLGAFEIAPFDAGTNAVAQAAARLTREGRLLTVAGGGDTVAALRHAGADEDFSFISTAGGAFLEWLEGKELPGVAALTK